MKNETTLRRDRRHSTFLHDERGLSTVEYVVLLVLICAGCVGLWSTFGQDVHDKLEGAAGEFRDGVDSDYGSGDDGESK